MDESRRQYRTSPDPRLGLRVMLLDARGRTHRTTVVDLSGGGMRLGLPPALQPPALGAKVTIRLDSPLLSAPIDVPTAVVQSETTDEMHCIGILFLDWPDSAPPLPAPIAAALNLRADVRFELDPARPVQVTVRGIEISFEITGVLRDISRSGLSFHAAPVAECALSLTDRVVLEFALPDLDRRLQFVGRIRNRDLSGASVRYGISFDAYHATNSREQRQAVEAYIAEHRKAALGELSAF